jgi:hypothetical protein
MKKSFETFRKIGNYEIGNLTWNDPSCFNGSVSIRKYRVTIEEIDETSEVLGSRLIKLWNENDNHHNWGPLKGAAKEIGVTLDNDCFGKSRA